MASLATLIQKQSRYNVFLAQRDSSATYGNPDLNDTHRETHKKPKKGGDISRIMNQFQTDNGWFSKNPNVKGIVDIKKPHEPPCFLWSSSATD